MKKAILILLFSLCSGAQASYLTIGESAEVIPSQSYRIGGDLQLLTSDGGGMNVGAFLDAGWGEGMSSRFSFGVGKIDFHLGASFKWIPIPDVARQPAMGVKASLYTARYESENVNVIQVAPMLSKKTDSDVGLWTPYTAIALNVGMNSGSRTGTAFVVGTELLLKDYDGVHFASEIGMNLKDSIGHIAFFGSIPFDSKQGFKKRK